MRLTRAIRSPGRRSKYGVRTDAQGRFERTVDHITFASKREAQRYRELKLLERAGEIAELKLQPEYLLTAGPAGGKRRDIIGKYRADFSYWDTRTRSYVTEDVKGMRTALYNWKKRHVFAEHGVAIREV